MFSKANSERQGALEVVYLGGGYRRNREEGEGEKKKGGRPAQEP